MVARNRKLKADWSPILIIIPMFLALALGMLIGFATISPARANHNDHDPVWVAHDKRILTKNIRTGGVDCVILADKLLGNSAIPVAISCDWGR